MEWITKQKDLHKDFNTNKEALDYALTYIQDWCNKNGYEFRLTHNTALDLNKHRKNANRCIHITTKHYDAYTSKCYTYKLVISSYPKKISTGEYEERDVNFMDLPQSRKEEISEQFKEEDRFWEMFSYTERMNVEIFKEEIRYYARLERM